MQRLYKIIGALALALMLVAAPTASFASVFVGISVNFGPPALPVYEQPPCPAPDLVWTPGYWAYGEYGYYWVPGTWVAAPEVGFYWTPGYWGFAGDQYVWNAGYWGPQVGYYGGINYGYGYFGNGYNGGGWYDNHFRYNTAYTNVNRSYVRDVYVNRTVVNNYATSARISYNGGPHGIDARPSSTQLAYGRQHHLGATSVQQENVRVAAVNRNYLAKVNHGQPKDVAFSKPLATSHRPPGFAPITSRATTTHTAITHTTTYRGTTTRPSAYHAVTTHTATYRATTTYHAPAQTYHAPAYHTAPVQYHAPAQTYRAPAQTYHAQTYRAQTYHAPAQTFHGTPHVMSAGSGHPTGSGHPAPHAPAGGDDKHH